MQKTILLLVLSFTSHLLSLLPTRAQEQDPRDEEWLVVAPVVPAEEEPIRVTVQELKRNPLSFREKAIIVTGNLHIPGQDVIDTWGDYERLNYELRDGLMTLPMLVIRRTLDPHLKEELATMKGRHVEVIGRFVSLHSSDLVEMPREEVGSRTEGIVLDSLRELREEEVQEVSPEKSEQDAEKTPRARQRRPVPTLESSHPRAGSYGIPLSTEFRLTFSTGMDVSSLEGNVRLTYTRDQDAAPLELLYDEESHTLRVEPREKLRPLAELRLSLHRGIVSREGAPLVLLATKRTPLQSRRSATTADSDAVVVLTFTTRGYE